MDTALVLLTGVLVAITGYYAWQTRRMVDEMRSARLAGIQPRLVPVVSYNEMGVGNLSVENIGPGPALDANLQLEFEPGTTVSRIRLYLLHPGGRRHWNPAHGHQEALPQPYRPETHLPNHTHVRLTGTCRDLIGRIHSIDERTPVRGPWQIRLMGEWVEGPLR